MNKIEEGRRMAPTQIPVELHEWVRRQAFERRTTITAELTEAVELLRLQRERQDKAQERAKNAQRGSA